MNEEQITKPDYGAIARQAKALVDYAVTHNCIILVEQRRKPRKGQEMPYEHMTQSVVKKNQGMNITFDKEVKLVYSNGHFHVT